MRTLLVCSTVRLFAEASEHPPEISSRAAETERSDSHTTSSFGLQSRSGATVTLPAVSGCRDGAERQSHYQQFRAAETERSDSHTTSSFGLQRRSGATVTLPAVSGVDVNNSFLTINTSIVNWRMASSGMLRHVALVGTDVSEELIASIIRVTRIGGLGNNISCN
jgi:hypothetical protein